MWKGNLKFNWLTIAGLLVMLMFAGSAQAQEVVFEEPFDDLNLPGWDRSPGVAVEGGLLRVEPGNFAFHPDSWGDARVVAHIRWEGEGEFVIGTRAEGENSYHLLIGRDYLVVHREMEGDLKELSAVGGVPVPYGVWFQLEILLEGGRQQVFIDEAPVLEINDPAPLPAGGIWFETLGETMLEIDYLAVHTPSSTVEVPPENEGAPPEGAEGPAELAFEGGLTWVRTGGPLGGLGYDVRMHPDNPDIMYVTDALAGVFKSTDGGNSWSPINNGITVRTGPSQDSIPIFCLTIDPNDPETIWVGTQNTRGLFKSEDGGASWVMKVNGVVEQNGITFRGITVDPKNSQTIYAAAELSSWAWAGEEQPGREFDKVKGVVYKSTNGGDNWQVVWRGDNLARYILIDPRDSNVVYVSTGIFDREAANSDLAANSPGGVGILKSTDGGQTWNQMNNGLTNLYIGTLFMHPDNPDILLAGAANNAYREGSGVFLTTDGGQIWTRVLETEAQSVEFSMTDPMTAYAGNPGAIYRSIDGGFTWDMMLPDEGGWGSPGVESGFPIDFQVDPRNSDRIFANNYGGGNFLSEDGGRTWTNASNGYTGALIRGLATSPSEPGVVYAVARSGIFISTDGGGTWQGLIYPEAHGLDWNAVAIDPLDQYHVLGASNWNQALNESHDGGLSWSLIPFTELSMQGGRSIVFAPSDPQIAYSGFGAFYSAGSFENELPASGVYVSRDGGSTWSDATDEMTATTNVSSLAVHPTNPQMVYMTAPSTGLFKTEDGGTSWAALDGLPGNVRPFSVAIDPFESDHLLVGSEGQGLYSSRDGGNTWTQIYSGVTAESSIPAILFHPTIPGVVFYGSLFSGVYRSSDGGQTWFTMSDELLNRAVTSLAISADGWHLYAGTDGGGVFRLDFNGQPPAAGQPLMNDTTLEGEPTGEEPSSPVEPPEGQSGQTGEEQPPLNPPASSSRNLIFGIAIGAGAATLIVAVILLLTRRKR